MRKLSGSSITTAADRIKEYVPVTNLTRSNYLSDLINGNVYLKEEHRQITNSFKLRGAANAILTAIEKDNTDIFVTASTGNHALAFCHILSKVQKRGVIFVTSTIPAAKLEKLQKIPFIDLKIIDGDPQLGELAAREYASKNDLKFVSPYNDYDVIAGQGTCGLEIMKANPEIDNIFVCVGGGGLISGTAIAAKHVKKTTNIIGCLPKNGDVMLQSIQSKKIVDLEYKETLSDGSAGNLEPGAVTFELCQANVDEWATVTENEIRNGILIMAEKEKQIVEGAAGVAVASFLQMVPNLNGKNVAIILCGGNINPNVFSNILTNNV